MRASSTVLSRETVVDEKDLVDPVLRDVVERRLQRLFGVVRGENGDDFFLVQRHGRGENNTAEIGGLPTRLQSRAVNDATLPPASRRTDLLALGLLFLIATISFADVLFGVNQLYMRDLTRYYYPTKQILREIVQHGEFPYWNRYFSAGQPIAANPEHEVFYPLTWLILLPSYDLGYRLHILIHIYIGLLGMYALLRSMDLRPPAAWFGALSFGLGGIYLSYVNLLPILFCAAWLPLTCLFVRRFLLRRNLRDFAAAALFLGMQFLVAEPTTVMQTGVLIGMYALYRGWYARPRRVEDDHARPLDRGHLDRRDSCSARRRSFRRIDHVHDSARSRPFDFDLVSAWSMPWPKFAELIYPNILGHISIGNVMWYWGGGLYPGMGSPFLFSIYAGIAVTALAIGGAFARPRGGRFVLLIVLFSSLLALGGHTPLLRWLYDAGIATSIRYPEKFILMARLRDDHLRVADARPDAGRRRRRPQRRARIRGGDDAGRGDPGHRRLHAALSAPLQLLSKATDIASLRKAWSATAGSAATYAITLSRTDWIIAAVRGGALIALLVTRAQPRQARLARRRRGVRHRRPRLRHVGAQPARAAALLRSAAGRRARFRRNRADFRVFHEADWYGTEKPAQQVLLDRRRRLLGRAQRPLSDDAGRLAECAPFSSAITTRPRCCRRSISPTRSGTSSAPAAPTGGSRSWPCRTPGTAASTATSTRRRSATTATSRTRCRSRFVEGPHYPRYYFADQIVTIRDRADFVKQLTHVQLQQRRRVRGPAVVRPGARRRARASSRRRTPPRSTSRASAQGFLVMSVTPHKYWSIRIDGTRVPAVITNIALSGHHRHAPAGITSRWSTATSWCASGC